MEIAPAATLLAVVRGHGDRTRCSATSAAGSTRSSSRLIDAFLAIPGIIFLIAVITSLGTSVPTLIITIGLAFTPIIARTVRAAVLAEAGQDYVQAAKLRGERAPYILFVEILPNIVPPIIVEATVRLGYAIFTLAGITFLGLGLQPPTPDWSVDITAGLPESQRHLPRRLLLDRCSSPGSRSSRSAWRSRCWPIACSRCSTGERTHGDRADGRRQRPRRPSRSATSASTTACAASGARCCAASASRSSAAAPTASSASRAAASRRPRWRRSATCRATGA